MTEGTANGYVTEIDYTFGYYEDLNPTRLEVSLALAGVKPPAIENACELGFGQGLSVNILASGSLTNWYGTDINPNHADYADKMARSVDNGAKLVAEAFDTYFADKDLPEFDYIAMHGIWSWVSDENRRLIIDFLKTKLRPGGLLYISYNVLAGWATMLPLRELFAEQVRLQQGKKKLSLDAVDAGLSFLDDLKSTGAAFLMENKSARSLLEEMGEDEQEYLAHEFLNSDWEPMSFMTMNRWMEQADMSFVADLDSLPALDHLDLTPEQLELLDGCLTEELRQATKDVIENRSFRKDLWVKKPVFESAKKKEEIQRRLEFVLTERVEDIPSVLETSRGEIPLKGKAYKAVLNALKGHQSISVAELEERLASRKIDLNDILEALQKLIAVEAIEPALSAEQMAQVEARCVRFNNHVLDISWEHDYVHYLASPVLGGGLSLDRIEQMFIRCMQVGMTSEKELVNAVWAQLEKMEHILMDDDGEELHGKKQNLKQLKKLAKTFMAERLDLCRALKLV